MTRKLLTLLAALGIAVAMPWTTASGAPDVQLSGAIFTTDSTGNPVNLNIYDSKEDVYLNGGPGQSAPPDAAGLPAGDYYFQVTDPSGKELLSSDTIGCRQFTVDDSGVITAVGGGSCAHEFGTSTEDGGLTVQLFPYDDTPNNGGVYKVWVTPVDLYNADMDEPGNSFGFVPRYSKTDNFKVKEGAIVEIDTRFWKNGTAIDGLAADWTDTLGAHNTKYSEYNPRILAFHEAHVEAAEQGRHEITVQNQAGCTIDSVTTPTGATVSPTSGRVTVPVFVKNHKAGDKTYFVDVYCH